MAVAHRRLFEQGDRGGLTCFTVAGLGPANDAPRRKQDRRVDARVKPAHDESNDVKCYYNAGWPTIRKLDRQRLTA